VVSDKDNSSQDIQSHNNEFDLDPLPENKSRVVTKSLGIITEAFDISFNVLLQTDGVQH